jgi:hypothetical protein
MVNVQAVADVSVAVKIVPAVIAKVAVAPTVPLATMVSVYAVGVKLVDDVSVVNAPVPGVVAPTVPLMLILAVPVRLVTVPLEGVPNAPLNVTKAPAEPTLTPRAVTTPVPVVVVDGATPAPPPMTKALAVKAAEVAQVVALEK